MQHPELPLFAFLTAILVLIPVPWHWRARNVATLAIIAWLFVVDVIFGVNSLVWAGNVNNPIPVWCDISALYIDHLPDHADPVEQRAKSSSERLSLFH